MATFAHFEKPCGCEICGNGHRAVLKSRTTAAAVSAPMADVAEVLTAMRPALLRVARVQLLNRGLDEQNAEDLVRTRLSAGLIARRIATAGQRCRAGS